MKVTVGLATYDDFEGAYFTVQSLRMHQQVDDLEVIVIDNFGCDYTQDFVETWVRGGRYFRYTGVTGTSAPRDLVFHKATGDVVVCVDSHVLLEAGALRRLSEYFGARPGCKDLVQGPMYSDDLVDLNTHFDPVWRDHMWGTWGSDRRAADVGGEPFDIPMQGLGLFACRREAWPGFNPRFRGFGGEEGYIHEKFRRAGGRCLCAPWLRWAHRFGRPYGVPYPLNISDRVFNYLVGHDEVGLDTGAVIGHFSLYMPREALEAIAAEALGPQGAAKAMLGAPAVKDPARRGADG